MKLLRYGDPGEEQWGMLDSKGKVRNLADFLLGVTGDELSPFWLGQLQKIDPNTLPFLKTERRIGPPVPRPLNFVCIGLNYADHAAETGGKIPKEPIIFLKSLSAFSGPYDDIKIPRGSQKTDWEVELGVVIGREARYVESVEAAAAHIGGYCVSHDVSERAFQLERGGQWTKGKSCDTFNPLGPWVATPDAIGDAANLAMSLKVNGESRQHGNTARMVFDPPYLIHYLSQFMTLEPGDLISTGTPPGVGLGMKPPQYLKAGDVVDLEIEGLGSQRQTFVNA